MPTKPSSNEPQFRFQEDADWLVTITIEIDADLLAQVTEVLKPYGLTPEDAAVRFFEYCVDPATKEHAIELLKQWKEEQALLETESADRR